MSDLPDCSNCGHPANHHEGGTSCWTDAVTGDEVWDVTEDMCSCGWYEPEAGA